MISKKGKRKKPRNKDDGRRSSKRSRKEVPTNEDARRMPKKNDRTYPWGGGLMTWKPNVRGWQATCALCPNGPHVNLADPGTKCTQSMNVSTTHTDDMVQRRLKHWLNVCQAYPNCTEHMNLKARDLPLEDVPSEEQLLADKLPSDREAEHGGRNAQAGSPRRGS